MDNEYMLSYIDHTLLKQTATWEQVKTLCDEAINAKTASVCIPPCFVKQAANYVEGKIPICTVIGFPNGYNTTACKVFETNEAVSNGASEIDMVINLGFVKDKNFDAVAQEIQLIRNACKGNILKVIIETCFLSENEKTELCRIITNEGADYIKTSTGFASEGAKVSDIKLFQKNIGNNVKIKAAGGIRTLEDAEIFIKSGVARIGTSALVKLITNKKC